MSVFQIQILVIKVNIGLSIWRWAEKANEETLKEQRETKENGFIASYTLYFFILLVM